MCSSSGNRNAAYLYKPFQVFVVGSQFSNEIYGKRFFTLYNVKCMCVSGYDEIKRIPFLKQPIMVILRHKDPDHKWSGILRLKNPLSEHYTVIIYYDI